MTTIGALLQSALATKARRRRELALQPYAEKLRMLLRLQRMADTIRSTRGFEPRAWPIDEATLLPIESPCLHGNARQVASSS